MNKHELARWLADKIPQVVSEEGELYTATGPVDDFHIDAYVDLVQLSEELIDLFVKGMK